jgi:hypothetical protein
MLDIEKFVESDGLYVTSLPQGGSFCWRLLSLKEYKVFTAIRQNGQINEYQLYSMVFDRCFVGNPLLLDGALPMGLFFSIGRLILELSGDSGAEQEKQDLENFRQIYPRNTLLEFMKRVILRAFPSYTPEAIERWTKVRVFKEFVVAEAVLQEGVGYTPLSLENVMSPDEMAKKATKKKGAVNFEKENSQLNQAMGSTDGKHFIEQTPEDLAKRVRLAKKLGGR